MNHNVIHSYAHMKKHMMKKEEYTEVNNKMNRITTFINYTLLL